MRIAKLTLMLILSAMMLVWSGTFVANSTANGPSLGVDIPLVESPANNSDKVTRIAVVFSNDFDFHLLSDTENSIYDCCIHSNMGKKFPKHSIKTFFLKRDDGTKSTYVEDAVLKKLVGFDVIVVVGDEAFNRLAVPHLYGKTKAEVIFTAVHRFNVAAASATIKKDLLVGEQFEGEIAILDEFMNKRGLSPAAWYVVYSQDVSSAGEAGDVVEELGTKRVVEKIQVQDLQELRIKLSSIASKPRGVVVNLVESLWSRDHGRKLFGYEVANAVSKANTKHLEVSMHADYVNDGFMLSVAHGTECKKTCFDFTKKRVTKFEEVLSINKKRATELGYGSLLEDLTGIGRVR